MFSRWKKIPATLHLVIHSVNLKKQMPDDFKITYTRGNHSGATDIHNSDSNGIINFESQYEIPCTMYLAKSDNKVREKIVNIMLMRYPDSKGAPKIYGKLSLDVGRYFSNKTTVKKIIEMESGRSVTPILTVSMSFNDEKEPLEVAEVDKNDVSFVEEKPVKIDISAWDQTDIEEIDENSNSSTVNKSDRKKTHKRKSRRIKKLQIESDANNDNNEVIDEQKDNNEIVNDQNDNNEAKDEQIDNNEIKDEQIDNNEVKDEQNDVKDENNEKQEEEEVQEKKVEIAIEKSVPEENPKVKEISAKIVEVVSHKWEGISNLYIDDSFNCPCPLSIFPLYSIILYSDLLTKNAYTKKEFKYLVNLFFDTYKKVEFRAKYDKFLTTLMLTLLIQSNVDNQEYDEERIKYFIKKLQAILDKDAKTLVLPLLSAFKVLVNRYSTANFDAYQLLDDFKELIDRVKVALNFTPRINEYLLFQLISLLDAKLTMKVIANPERFTLTNSITWKSFVSAFETQFEYQLTNLGIVVNTLLMSPNIARSTPEDNMVEDLCGDFGLEFVCYIICNYHTDDMMENEIDIKKFLESFHLEESKKYEGKVHPYPVNDFLNISEKLRLDIWNKKSNNTDKVIQEFGFLSQYVAKDEENNDNEAKESDKENQENEGAKTINDENIDKETKKSDKKEKKDNKKNDKKDKKDNKKNDKKEKKDNVKENKKSDKKEEKIKENKKSDKKEEKIKENKKSDKKEEKKTDKKEKEEKLKEGKKNVKKEDKKTDKKVKELKDNKVKENKKSDKKEKTKKSK